MTSTAKVLRKIGKETLKAAAWYGSSIIVGSVVLAVVPRGLKKSTIGLLCVSGVALVAGDILAEKVVEHVETGVKNFMDDIKDS